MSAKKRKTVTSLIGKWWKRHIRMRGKDAVRSMYVNVIPHFYSTEIGWSVILCLHVPAKNAKLLKP